MKSVVILGSTGSIGESALKVVAAARDRLRVVGLCARGNTNRLLEQAVAYGVGDIAVADAESGRKARDAAPASVKVHTGDEGVCRLAELPEADLVLCALVGLSGLRPVLRAMEAGHDVALATKEVLVAAGETVMDLRADRGVRLLPVDSEHSALFQCIERSEVPACVRPRMVPGQKNESAVSRLVLTASGGPFAGREAVDFSRVGVDEALCHPNWSMGRKVTIDSATMMNKGLEVMEAHWLFGTPLESIDILIHPESIVHGLAEMTDGSVLAHMSPPDMQYAIHHALHWPECRPSRLPRLDLGRVGALHFFPPDRQRFPCLELARRAAGEGRTCPAVLNAANEVAVQAFLDRRINFAAIWHIVEEALAAHVPGNGTAVEDIEAADAWARRLAEAWIGRHGRETT